MISGKPANRGGGDGGHRDPCDPLSELVQVYNAAPVGLAVLDRGLRYVRINEVLASLNGKPVEEHIGRTISEVIPHVAPEVELSCRKTVETGEPTLDVEVRAPDPDGLARQMHYLIDIHPLKSDEGVVGVVAFVRDVTKRRWAEEAGQERLQFETLLTELSATFINLPADRVDQEIESAQRRIVEALGLDRSALAQLDSAENDLIVTHSWAVPGVNRDPGLRGKRDLPWVSERLLRGETVPIHRLSDLPEEAAKDGETFRRIGQKSSVAFPLAAGGDVFGALAFGACREERAWPVPLIQRLQLVAEVFANALGRKRATETLRESEDFNRTILSSLSDHIAALERDGKIIAVNDAWNEFARANGAVPMLAAGPGVNYLDICRKASRQGDEIARVAMEGIRSVLGGFRETFEFEYPCDSPTESRWFVMRVVPFKHHAGGAIVSHKEITARRRAEVAVQSAYDRLRLIANVTATVVGSAPLADQAKEMAGQVRAAFGADACVIRTLEGDELVLLANVGMPPESARPSIKADWGISEEIVGRCRPVFIADVRVNPITAGVVDRLPHSYHFTSYAGVPLLVSDCVVGALGLYWEQECRDFAESDLGHLQTLANNIAVSIVNDRLHRQVADQRDRLTEEMAEREKAERFRQRSEARYRDFVTYSTEGVARFELEQPIPISLPEDEQIDRMYRHGYVAECNDALAHMYRRARAADMHGVRLGDMLVRAVPGNTEFLRAFIRAGYRMMDAESCERDRLGDPRWFSNSFTGIVENGRLVGAWGVQREITERKQMLESIQKAADAWQTTFDSIRDLIMILDRDFRILRVNAATHTFFDRPPDKVLGNHCYVLMHGTSAPPAECPVARMTCSKVHEEGEIYHPQRGVWLLVSADPILDERGEIAGVVHTVKDITERKQAEKSLRDLGGRLIKAQEEERTRIARELHDDLNQRLALLAVELEVLGRNVPETADAILQRTQALSLLARELSSDVHRLSHHLHPSKLEQLGLAVTLRGHCREFAEAHGIDVEFIERDMPRTMAPDVALCLYRIAQESLQNVAKHSGAKQARVEVCGGPGEVVLNVADGGRGFDPECVKHKAGLGLVGMQERLRLVGGEMSITSGPSRGATIKVRVPLRHTAS